MLSLNIMIKRLARDVYHNIFEILILSFIHLVIMLPGIVIKYFPFRMIYVTVFLVTTLGGIIYTLDNRIINGYMVSYREVFVGLKKYYFRMLKISMILEGFLLILYSSYLYMKNIGSKMAIVGFTLQIGTFITISLVLMYALPLIIKQDITVKEGLIKGLKILSDNIFYSIGAMIQIVSIFILLTLTVVGIPLVFIGVFSMFLLENYYNVMKKYVS